MGTDVEKYLNLVKSLNLNKYYNILTMGCKLNENDSEKIAGMLEKMGFKPTKDLDKADIYILNTCCVRENAEEKLFGKLRRTKKIKRRKKQNHCYCWLYDARKAYAREIKEKLSFC